MRAIDLLEQYLGKTTEATHMVLRIFPGNTPSLKLAEKAGFTLQGLFDEPEGRMARYIRALAR